MPTMQLFKRRAACALSSRKLSGLSVAQSDFSISLGASRGTGRVPYVLQNGQFAHCLLDQLQPSFLLR